MVKSEKYVYFGVFIATREVKKKEPLGTRGADKTDLK
jgi:hypothetical protein